jgi:DNA-binding transcriptional regulator GbsR (MarR family)
MPTLTSAKTSAPPTAPNDAPPDGVLSPLDVEIVSFFVRIARLLGAPKSLGEIYGLLYCTEAPLSLDDICQRVKMSRGSASQGLRILKSVGAVKIVYLPGNRRDHFSPETELRKLASVLLKEQIESQIEGGEARLERMGALLGSEPPGVRAFKRGRVQKLQAWSRQGRRLLPLIRSFLSIS